MKIFVRPSQAEGLKFRLELLSSLLHFSMDVDDNEMFRLFYPGYKKAVVDLKKSCRIKYIDCDIEFYADGLGLKSN